MRKRPADDGTTLPQDCVRWRKRELDGTLGEWLVAKESSGKLEKPNFYEIQQGGPCLGPVQPKRFAIRLLTTDHVSDD